MHRIILAAALIAAFAANVAAQCPGGVCQMAVVLNSRSVRPATTRINERISAASLELPSDEIARKTIGDVSADARKKYTNFEDYVAARRRDSIAGKGFEAFFAIDYNAAGETGKILLPTAALGRPTDPADLALIDLKSRRILALYQCKIGVHAAVRAAGDPKYKAFTILVPADVLQRIVADADEETAAAVESGRITDAIGTIQTATRDDYETRSLEFLRWRFDEKEAENGQP